MMDFSTFIIKDYFTEYELSINKPLDSPRYLQIEITNRCNLKCTSCIHAYNKKNFVDMSLANFTKTIEQLPMVEHVSFVGGGETLLLDKFEDYIRLCSSKGIFSSCTTNGILIKKQISQIIEAGLGRIAISVDAADDLTLKNIRPGLTVKRLRDAIIIASQMTMNSETILSAAITLSSLNLSSFEYIVKLLIDCGIKEITVESFHNWGEKNIMNIKSLFNMNPNYVIERIEKGLIEAKNNGVLIRIFDYKRVLNKGEVSNCICPWPWDSIYITSNGDITPCCVNIESSPKSFMGNIFHDDISNVWNGQRYNNLRESFFNYKEWDLCSNCVYRMEFGLINK